MAEDLMVSLREHRAQLADVDIALEAAAMDPDAVAELTILRADLLEIITVLEEQIVAIRKSQLLCALDVPVEETKSLSSNACCSEIGEEVPSSSSAEIVDVEDTLTKLIGLRCRAIYRTSDSSVLPIMHNAIVCDVLATEDSDIENLQVQVLFMNPMTIAMKPCPYYLEERCSYSAADCKYSHGVSVRFGDLFDYEDPDFASLAEGSLCLVKNEHDLWSTAHVTHISREESMLAVCLQSTGREVAVPFADALPVVSYGDDDPSMSIGPQLVNTAEATDCGEFAPVLGSSVYGFPCSDTSLNPIASWEQHTKGIATKLMNKMGYVVGQGLGKEGAGRTEPIAAHILPKGKSLDVCFAQIAKNKADPLHQLKKEGRKAKRQQLRLSADYQRTAKKTVFDIINGHLRASSSCVDEDPKKTSSTQNFRDATSKSLNVKLFTLQEQVKAEEKVLLRLKIAMQRNVGRDGVIAAQLEKKCKESQGRLQALHATEQSVQKETQRRSDKKKMSVF